MVSEERAWYLYRGRGPLYKYHVRSSLTILHSQPMKMEQIECSETSAYNNQTPGKCPKEYIQDSKHGESLKSRRTLFFARRSSAGETENSVERTECCFSDGINL